MNPKFQQSPERPSQLVNALINITFILVMVLGIQVAAIAIGGAH